jgi:calcium binding protein 39
MSSKTAQDLVRGVVDESNSTVERIASLRSALCSDVDGQLLFGTAAPANDLSVRLCGECVAQALLPRLFAVLFAPATPFECKKDIAVVLTALLRVSTAAAAAAGDDSGQVFPVAEHIASARATLLDRLIDGYERSDTALVCGAVLRECVRHEPLAALVLASERVWTLFEHVQCAQLDVAADALSTLSELLTTHREPVFAFLSTHFARFFGAYRELLRSRNYVTRRQALKLLGDVIVHRRNFAVMSRYIGVKVELLLMMNLLRDKSRSIQFEAFHVFKVFVANPNMNDDIRAVLRRNRALLVPFLADFRPDIDDDQFKRERAFLIKSLNAMV